MGTCKKKIIYPGKKDFQSHALSSILLLTPMLSIYPDEEKKKKQCKIKGKRNKGTHKTIPSYLNIKKKKMVRKLDESVF